MENDKIQYRNAMAKAQTEIDSFKQKIRVQSDRESAMVAQIEKLKQKILKIRSQINLQHTGKFKDLFFLWDLVTLFDFL